MIVPVAPRMNPGEPIPAAVAGPRAPVRAVRRRRPGRYKPDRTRFAELRLRIAPVPDGFPVPIGRAKQAFAVLALGCLGAWLLGPKPPADPHPAEEVFVLEDGLTRPEDAYMPSSPPASPSSPQPKTLRMPDPFPPPAGKVPSLSGSGQVGPGQIAAVDSSESVLGAADANADLDANTDSEADAGSREAERSLTAASDANGSPMREGPLFVEREPMLLAGEPPAYPEAALERGSEATVIALLTIDADGAVTEASVEKSGGPDFDAAVLASARATRFRPPMRQGRNVPAWFRRQYQFALE